MSEPCRNLHERIVNRDHEDLSGVFQSWVVDETRHVGARTRRACGSGGSLVSYRHRNTGSGVPWLVWKLTERSRDANNNALALKLLGDVDLVAGRGLDEVDVGDGIANLHAGTRRRLEAAGCAKGAGSN
jgi:hypothetical protein